MSSSGSFQLSGSLIFQRLLHLTFLFCIPWMLNIQSNSQESNGTPLSGICLPVALSLFPLPALLYLRDIQSIETYTYINMHICVYFHSPFFYSLSHKFYESIFFLLFSSVLQRLESLLAHCKYSMNMCRIDK